MGTVIEAGAIVVRVSPEILGPGSVYETRKSELKKEHHAILEAASRIESIDSPETEARAVEFGRLLQAASKEIGVLLQGNQGPNRRHKEAGPRG